MPRYVTLIDHDSIFELAGDASSIDHALAAFQLMAADSGATVSNVADVPAFDSSIVWAPYVFLAFDATPADVAALAARYSFSDDDAPITYVDYLRLRQPS